MNDSTKEGPAQVEPVVGTSVAPSPQGEPPSTSSLFIKVFPSIMLPMFLAVADQTIVATALPAIASGLGEIERASWVVVSYLIANTIAALELSDRACLKLACYTRPFSQISA